MSSTRPRRRFTVQPRPWHIIPAVIAFFALVIIGGLASTPLREQGDAVGAALISLLAVSVFIALTAVIGWLPAIMRERHRHPHLWPALLVGGVILAYLITEAATVDWSAPVAAVILSAAIVGLVDGLAEEITFRGAVLVAARSRWREVWVWMSATLIFACSHFLGLGGQSLEDTLIQVFFAVLAGTSFYVLRRATGSLILPIVFHGCNNFLASFPSEVSPWWQIAAMSVGVIGLVPVIRSADRARTADALPADRPLA